MVPDHGSRVETQRPAVLLQLPAHIDVVASDTELRIEPPYRLQGSFAKRHVTAWNVLRFLVREQDVDWVTRGVGDTLGDWPIAGGCDVWSTDSHVGRAHEGSSQVGKPMRVRVGIIVKIGDELTRSRFQAGIARAAQPTILRADQTEAILLGNISCGIG